MSKFPWITTIRNALNAGLLPEGFFALAEKRTGGPVPDVVTLSLPMQPGHTFEGGLALAEAPIKTRYTAVADATRYAQKADRIKIHSPDGDVVAVIEIVSPGNKDSGHAVKSFVREAVEFLNAGIHLLIVDLFPPSKRDPQGLHKGIWDRLRDEEFRLPPDAPLTVVSYLAGMAIRAFVEPVAVGQALPDMPIFLTSNRYVLCPLESTYQTSWAVFPKVLKGPLEAPKSDIAPQTGTPVS
ncbi:MAG TPA: DUF4058 family protein [Urbifossiella sp.]